MAPASHGAKVKAAFAEKVVPILCVGEPLEVRQQGGHVEHTLAQLSGALEGVGADLAKQVVEEVRQHLPDKIFNTVIPRTVRLSEAPSFGKPIFAYDPHGPGAKAYHELSKEVAARFELKPAGP